MPFAPSWSAPTRADRRRLALQRVFEGSEPAPDAEAFTVVGVVGAVRQAGLTEDEAQGAAYFPFAHRLDRSLFVVTRASVPADAAGRTLQAVVRRIDPELRLAFGVAWDLRAVKPAFFPVPCCVANGRRANPAVPIGGTVEVWSGRLPKTDIGWPTAAPHITRGANAAQRKEDPATSSPYAARFSQGATIVPRVLFAVEKETTGPLGAGAGRWAVRSRRSPNEKEPWKSLATIRGTVERQFVRPMHLGETLLPYRMVEPLLGVIPWDGKRLLDTTDDRLAAFPGLSEWWTSVAALWMKHRSSENMVLRERLDYQRGLSQQFPLPECRVVYTKSGMYLAAAIVRGDALIDHSLYWGTASSLAEAHYLEAVLNSDVTTQRLRPLQARGEHNPRHYDKYVWKLPIPMYDPQEPLHSRLGQLAEQAEAIAAAVELPTGKRFESLRSRVRQAVADSDTGREIADQVRALLK
jgi:hypothetical protein